MKHLSTLFIRKLIIYIFIQSCVSLKFCGTYIFSERKQDVLKLILWIQCCVIHYTKWCKLYMLVSVCVVSFDCSKIVLKVSVFDNNLCVVKVHQEPLPAPGNCVQHSPHPVVVQSVYVGRKEDDEKDKKECTCKEKCKKKKMERYEDNDEYEDMELDDDRDMRRARNRRNRMQRRNTRLRMQDPYDPYYPGGYYDEPMMCGGCSDCCSSFCPSRVIYID